MNEVRFEIPGKPVAFIAAWDKQDWKKKRAYMEWVQFVRICARRAGFDAEPATKAMPICIHTRCWFKNGVHPDPENVHKAVVDALMYELKNRDKYTGGAFPAPLYDPLNPRVEIVIADGRLPLRHTIPETW